MNRTTHSKKSRLKKISRPSLRLAYCGGPCGQTEKVMRMRFKAVLFDIDGTLLSLAPIVGALQRACRRLGVPVLSKKEIYTRAIGHRLSDFFPKLRPAYAHRANEFRNAFYEEYGKVQWLGPLPGARKTLLALRRLGVKTAAVSTKGRPIAEPGLRKAKLLCDLVISGDDARSVKPDPEPLLKALRAFRVKPRDALVVGDHFFDVQAAKRAGCTACGITTGACSRNELLKAGADLVINRIDSVLKIVSGDVENELRAFQKA